MRIPARTYGARIQEPSVNETKLRSPKPAQQRAVKSQEPGPASSTEEAKGLAAISESSGGEAEASVEGTRVELSLSGVVAESTGVKGRRVWGVPVVQIACRGAPGSRFLLPPRLDRSHELLDW